MRRYVMENLYMFAPISWLGRTRESFTELDTQMDHLSKSLDGVYGRKLDVERLDCVSTLLKAAKSLMWGDANETRDALLRVVAWIDANTDNHSAFRPNP